mgnify:CR=1 FL=1
MKTFLNFLTEAGKSKASVEAQRKNLVSDRKGKWLDQSGNPVGYTNQGELKFYDKKKEKDEGGEGRTAQSDQPEKQGFQPAPVIQKPTNGRKYVPFPKVDQDAVAANQEGQESEELEQQVTQALEDAPELGGGDLENPITITFGRFNPPTVGHEKLLQAAKTVSAGADLKVYPSRTHEPKKNPLSPGSKIEFMKKMFPDYEENIVDNPNMKSIFDVLKSVSNAGYGNINIVVGADRQAEFENLANKYNGDLYDFEQIRVISAGVRDADAEGVEGMSASKLRKAVIDGDGDAFVQGMPKSLESPDIQNLFNAVKAGMSVPAKKKEKKETNESYDLWEVAPKYDWKNLRENYIQEKIFNIGDIVENLNTGVIGRIIRRGTNYLICLAENNLMFKSWIKDVAEQKLTDVSGVSGDQRLVGTDSLRRYAEKMVPGSDWGRQFINKYRKKKK